MEAFRYEKYIGVEHDNRDGCGAPPYLQGGYTRPIVHRLERVAVYRIRDSQIGRDVIPCC